MKPIKYILIFCLALMSINVSAQTTRACATNTCPNVVCSTLITGTNPNVATNCANFCCINVSNSQTVEGTLTAACQTITGNLTVGGTVDIEGSLITEGNSDFRGSVCIGQSLTVGQNTTIGGNQTVEGSLDVNNGAFINGQLIINGNELLNGNLSVSQNETINGNLLVDQDATVNGLLTANGGLVVANGEVINSGGLVVVSGGASITGDLLVDGSQSVDDLDILGNLTVDENAFFNGCSTTVNGALIANGPVTMNRGLTIASGNETITSGNLSLNSGNLTVGGQSVFNGPTTANRGLTVNQGLTVFGGQTISTGGLTIGTCGNMTIGGQLVVGNAISSPSRATLFGLTITDGTNSTSPTTGALIVNGGIGIGGDLWLGGSEFFQHVVDEGGTPSPFNYYEETCVPMSFNFAGATPVTVQVQVVRIGNLVNLLVPVLIFGLGGTDTVESVNILPARFAPGCTVRGAASIIINDNPQLGEFEVRPDGTIIFGIPGPALGPQPFASTAGPQVDINTITYNRLSCGCPVT
ncbi:MAG: hypothetical protein AMXMBFR12_09320 [Candidatus Babeliales bacterium]